MPARVATVGSPRVEWTAVPGHVRGAVEQALGSSVVEAVTQLGGFSPGAASRAVLADGRRVFVKACGSSLNPDTPDLNRREIRALSLIPAHLPVARLLASYDDGDWVALALETSRAGGHRCPAGLAGQERVVGALTTKGPPTNRVGGPFTWNRC